MRLKAICRASFTVLAVLTTVCGIFAGPDIGGGSGRIMTPYKGAIKLADVATVKQFASKSRTATDVVIAGTHTTGGGGNLALMFASDGNSPVGAPMFSFQGINDAGKSATIDFSEIQSFLVSSDGKDATLAQVEVIQFPAISPADLL